MTELEKIRQFFKNDRFADGAGIVIDEIGDRWARCSMKLDERHKNAVGHVMGGAIFTLADFVFAVATNRPDASPTVTVSTSISFVGVGKGECLIGEAKLLKDGKRTCFYEVEIKDELGNFVAVASTVGGHIA